MSKITLEGNLFVLVEENEDKLKICAEISGFNIWDWLNQQRTNKVKVTLEELGEHS